MNNTNQPLHIELLTKRGVTDDDVQRELQSIWEALRTDPKLREAAREVGIDPNFLEEHPSTPFLAGRSEAQFGIAEAILISVASGVLTHVTKNVLDLLWDQVVWPRLARHFGADLEPKKNGESN